MVGGILCPIQGSMHSISHPSASFHVLPSAQPHVSWTRLCRRCLWPVSHDHVPVLGALAPTPVARPMTRCPSSNSGLLDLQLPSESLMRCAASSRLARASARASFCRTSRSSVPMVCCCRRGSGKALGLTPYIVLNGERPVAEWRLIL